MVSGSIGAEEQMMIKQLAVSLSAILILGLGFNYGAWAQAAAPEATQVQRDGDGESHCWNNQNGQSEEPAKSQTVESR